jgi:hypothetical protein
LHSAAVSLTILQYYHNECGLYLENMVFNLVIQATGVPVYYFIFGAKLVVVNS